MSNNKQKPTIFSEFVEQLRAENSENFVKSTENFSAVMNKLGLLGAFAMIKMFAENAENAIISSPFVPLQILKIYMNGIINICVVLEKAIVEQEKKLATEVVAENDSLNHESDNDDYNTEVVKDKQSLNDDEKLFNSLLSKLKKEKN